MSKAVRTKERMQHSLGFRATTAELRLLRRAARAASQTVADFLRQTCLDRAARLVVFTEAVLPKTSSSFQEVVHVES